MARRFHKPPKYTQPEIERRWLIHADALPPLAGVSWRQIEDKYLDGGRLRLRRMESPGGETLLKLGKKYAASPHEVENVVSMYLTPAEYDALNQLNGRVARKKRYAIQGGALDLYEHPNAGLAVFEIEFPDDDAAARYVPPPFVGDEITERAEYSGYALAGM